MTEALQRAATAAGTSRRSDLHTQLVASIVLAAILAASDVIAALLLRRLLRAGQEIRSLNANLEPQVQQPIRLAVAGRSRPLCVRTPRLRGPGTVISTV
jgi:hypothetical protein